MRYLLYGLLLALLAYAFTGVRQVGAGERLVVRRFGRVLEHKPGPGLWVGLPWGVDRVDRVAVDAEQRVTVGYRPEAEEDGTDTPPGQFLTGDRNLVNIQVKLDYKVREDEVADYAVQRDRVEGLLARAAEAALAEWAAGRKVDDVLTRGKAVLPEWLVRETQKRIRPYGLGVEVRQASVSHLLPPDRVKDSFDDVTRAETEKGTRIQEATQEATRTLLEAQAAARRVRLLVPAYVEQQEKLARSEADYLEGLQRVQNAPGSLLAQMWDAVQQLMKRKSEAGQVKPLPEGMEFHVPARGFSER